MEVEDRTAGVWVGQPPAGELRCAGFGGGEVDWFVGETYACRGACNRGVGVVEELPITLPVEQAEGEPGAAQGCEKCDGASFEEPARGDIGEGCGGLAQVGGGFFKRRWRFWRVFASWFWDGHLRMAG